MTVTASNETGSTPASTDDEPLLQVVAGNPTAEELAALTAVVASSQAGEDAAATGHDRTWVRRSALRLHPAPGPASWRRSALHR